jgi:hypothetical protein
MMNILRKPRIKRAFMLGIPVDAWECHWGPGSYPVLNEIVRCVGDTPMDAWLHWANQMKPWEHWTFLHPEVQAKFFPTER